MMHLRTKHPPPLLCLPPPTRGMKGLGHTLQSSCWPAILPYPRPTTKTTTTRPTPTKIETTERTNTSSPLAHRTPRYYNGANHKSNISTENNNKIYSNGYPGAPLPLNLPPSQTCWCPTTPPSANTAGLLRPRKVGNRQLTFEQVV